LKAARERLARVENGEVVAVLAPLTHKDLLRITGMTEAEMRHCERLPTSRTAARIGFGS
jgi:hypothetical protein